MNIVDDMIKWSQNHFSNDSIVCFLEADPNILINRVSNRSSIAIPFNKQIRMREVAPLYKELSSVNIGFKSFSVNTECPMQTSLSTVLMRLYKLWGLK